MTFKARCEFHTATRHYHVGDEVKPSDITQNVHELCLAVGSADVQVTKYKVTLNANGGTGADIVTETESYYRLPACTFTPPANQEFKTWAVQANGTGAKPVGSEISVVQDITYYAIWQNVKVTVKFDANGGSGTMSSVKTDKGAEYTLPSCTFTAPADKEFKGWSLDKSSTVTKVTPSGDVTVYALWQDLPKKEEEKDPDEGDGA